MNLKEYEKQVINAIKTLPMNSAVCLAKDLKREAEEKKFAATQDAEIMDFLLEILEESPAQEVVIQDIHNIWKQAAKKTAEAEFYTNLFNKATKIGKKRYKDSKVEKAPVQYLLL